MGTITGAQLRAARALIRWRAEDLADAAKVGVATVRRAEGVDGAVSMTAANEAALMSALELAGVEFIAENGGGAGVRLRKVEKPKLVGVDPAPHGFQTIVTSQPRRLRRPNE